MDKNIFLKKFALIFEESPVQEITFENNFRDFDEWCSITALNLISLLDEEYDVNLTGADLKSANTVGDIFNIIVNKKTDK
jgi:acyl carrier protein